jgi:tripartite-type tricarboxylate transporter receptor subunit TctC
MIKRGFIFFIALFLMIGSVIGQTVEFPTRPITLVSPTVPGGAMDSAARLLSEYISPNLGQPIVVDAKPGGGGAVGMAMAARLPGDGYNLVISVDSALTVVPALVPNIGYDPEKSFVPIIKVGTSPLVLVVHPSMGVKNLKEYIAMARVKPNSVQYGSGGNGSPHHLSMLQLERSANIKLFHVPYRGGPKAFSDLLGGHISSMFIVPSTAEAQIKKGALIPIAVTSSKRLAEMPNIPAISEEVPGYGDTDIWFGIFAPSGMSPEMVTRWNSEFKSVLTNPTVVQKLGRLSIHATPDTPEDLSNLLNKDLARMNKLIRDTGLKSE